MLQQYIKKRDIVDLLGREKIVMHFLLKDKRVLAEMLVDRLSAADLMMLYRDFVERKPIREAG